MFFSDKQICRIVSEVNVTGIQVNKAACYLIFQYVETAIMNIISRAQSNAKHSRRLKVVKQDIQTNQCTLRNSGTVSDDPFLPNSNTEIFYRWLVQSGQISLCNNTFKSWKLGNASIPKCNILKSFRSYYGDWTKFESLRRTLDEGDIHETMRNYSLMENDGYFHTFAPFFSQLIYTTVRRRRGNVNVMEVVLELVNKLLNSPNITVEPYLHQILPAVLSISLSRLSHGHSSQEMLSLKESAAVSVQHIVVKFSPNYPTLTPTVLSIVMKNMSHENVWSQYGCVCILQQIKIPVLSRTSAVNDLLHFKDKIQRKICLKKTGLGVDLNLHSEMRKVFQIFNQTLEQIKLVHPNRFFDF